MAITDVVWVIMTDGHFIAVRSFKVSKDLKVKPSYPCNYQVNTHNPKGILGIYPRGEGEQFQMHIPDTRAPLRSSHLIIILLSRKKHGYTDGMRLRSENLRYRCSLVYIQGCG